MLFLENNEIAALDAKEHFSEILEKVASGVQITITRNGSPVAKLSPLSSSTVEQRQAAIERILQLRDGLSLGGISVRSLIEEGRK